MRSILALSAVLLLPGCPDSKDPDPDARPADGAVDQGATDATPDADPPDAARPDATPDGAPPDATPPDGEADAEPDAAPDAADAGVIDPPADLMPAPLFDPEADGATPQDAPLRQMVDAWAARPTDEASAQANERDRDEALRQLQEAGGRAANRVVERCTPVPAHDRKTTLTCLRLLSLVESDRSLDWLSEKAALPVPDWPADAHPVDPHPAALAAQVAAWSLGQRAKQGSERATDLLVRLATNPQVHDKRHAIRALFDALPRVRAKARLRRVLPPEEHWRLYQWRQ